MGAQLEDAGVHVVYGLSGSRPTASWRWWCGGRGNGIRRYVHLGTGNYNPRTARVYTDFSLFTARDAFADDAAALFNLLTGYSRRPGRSCRSRPTGRRRT